MVFRSREPYYDVILQGYGKIQCLDRRNYKFGVKMLSLS